MSAYRSQVSIICVAVFYGMLLSSLAAQVSSKNLPPDHQKQYVNAEHLLDGTSFQYFYKAGGGLEIAFADGKLQYEWISGPRKGNHAENIPYQSRIIGDDMYLVNWHQPDKPDFVTLVINLRKQVLFSSAILRVGSENEMIHFKEAVIKEIKRTDP